MNGFRVNYQLNSGERTKRLQIGTNGASGTCLCPTCRARDRGRSRISLAKPGQPERGWRLN
jgi:hypothetical protein